MYFKEISSANGNVERVKGGTLTRREEREQAFILIFEMTMTNKTSDDILVDANDGRDFVVSEFSSGLFLGAEKHLEQIDGIIKDNIRGWNITRLSKVALSILRLSVYELLFEKSIPVNVSINEAVELAKTYGGEGDSAYVNGVLSSVEKNNDLEKKTDADTGH